ncbi:hypothetical protein BJV77DRAFT_745059 [Russula vinacea]|nr:hypothetical protein BJV77DRAFT_745059 [Russula vinacea]
MSFGHNILPGTFLAWRRPRCHITASHRPCNKIQPEDSSLWECQPANLRVLNSQGTGTTMSWCTWIPPGHGWLRGSFLYLTGNKTRGNLTPYLSWQEDDEGPDHQKVHHVTAKFRKRSIGYGRASDKATAKQIAAKEALKHLKTLPEIQLFSSS